MLGCARLYASTTGGPLNMNPIHSLETYVSRREVCEKLCLHPATVRRWERAGRLPYFRITGQCTRYKLADVLRLLLEAQHSGKRRPGPKPKAAPTTSTSTEARA